MASPSFPAWYSLPEQDPYAGEYTDVFAALATAAPVQDPVALLNHFLTGQDKKVAFVLLGADDLVCVIHHLQLFQSPLGEAQVEVPLPPSVMLPSWGQLQWQPQLHSFTAPWSSLFAQLLLLMSH